jgi:diguanylate cyclase (GGDEF)-like protein/PAS domain S-box-containing protein
MTPPLPCEERFRRTLDLSSEYYWEQDANHRFTFVQYRSDATPAPALLGTTRWDFGDAPVSESWDQHRTTLNAKLPFRDFVLERSGPNGTTRYLSVSGQPVFDETNRFLGYCGVTRDVTAETRLLTLERTVTSILARHDDFSEALTGAMQAICASEGWEAGQYWSVDPARDVLRFDVGWNSGRQPVAQLVGEARHLTFRRGEGLAGVVWQTGQPLWVEDLRREKRMVRKDVVERTGWYGALLLPVFSNDAVIGVLDFNAPVIPDPGERLLRIFRILGMQIGVANARAITVRQLRESEERYASTVELAAIGISHVGRDGRFLHVNAQFCQMLGYTREELLQLDIRQISHPDDAHMTQEPRARLHRGEIGSLKVEKRYLRKDGTSIWVRITAAVRRGEDGTPLYDISVVEDISDRKRAEERVQYLATHDEMTALPNRTTFFQLLEHAIESAVRYERHGAVLFVDLDRFKIINDSLGHAAGDLLLKETAARLMRCVRKADVVARLGGDEFVVLLDSLDDPAQAAAVARKLLTTILEPIKIGEQECRVTASIGIAKYPDDGRDAIALMKHADMAMYAAKEQGKNNVQFYSAGTSPMSIERLKLETHLRHALERNELHVQYQPRVDVATGTVTGAEALLRWWNQDLGAVSPAQFIPVAEETGLIIPIGRWVLKTACECSMQWRRQGLPAIVMAVNLSPLQFRDAELLSTIKDVLQETGLPAEHLELEITESMVMGNIEKALATINTIKALGVRFAIDDFGTGYSSLAQLKRLPIDTLKVDRSFIRDVSESPQDQAITEAIIRMGKTLGITVIGEGVETAAQYAFLSGHACDEIQGFYFSEPCHPDGFATFLSQSRGTHRRKKRRRS